eukprot:4035134-Prorocentrum_lima.AAC.1
MRKHVLERQCGLFWGRQGVVTPLSIALYLSNSKRVTHGVTDVWVGGQEWVRCVYIGISRNRYVSH